MVCTSPHDELTRLSTLLEEWVESEALRKHMYGVEADKAFARGVHRDAVQRGIELIGLPRARHISNVIDGLKAVADVLEVRGEDQARRRR